MLSSAPCTAGWVEMNSSGMAVSKYGIWTMFSACEEDSKPILAFPVVVWVFQRSRGQTEHLQISGGLQDHGIILGRRLSLERHAACSMDYGINVTIRVLGPLSYKPPIRGTCKGHLYVCSA